MSRDSVLYRSRAYIDTNLCPLQAVLCSYLVTNTHYIHIRILVDVPTPFFNKLLLSFAILLRTLLIVCILLLNFSHYCG